MDCFYGHRSALSQICCDTSDFLILRDNELTIVKTFVLD